MNIIHIIQQYENISAPPWQIWKHHYIIMNSINHMNLSYDYSGGKKPKIDDLQAHSATQRDTLWACRSSIFGKELWCWQRENYKWKIVPVEWTQDVLSHWLVSFTARWKFTNTEPHVSDFMLVLIISVSLSHRDSLSAFPSYNGSGWNISVCTFSLLIRSSSCSLSSSVSVVQSRMTWNTCLLCSHS